VRSAKGNVGGTVSVDVSVVYPVPCLLFCEWTGDVKRRRPVAARGAVARLAQGSSVKFNTLTL